MSQGMKFIAEMGPLLLFFATYKFNGLIFATGVLIVATCVSVAFVYFKERKIPLMPLISAVILGIFGGLTLVFADEIFIKIKPTLVNILFAAILFAGVFKGRGLLKHLFGSALKMNEEAWVTFSFRWGVFFLCLAGLNEVIWRNFDTDFWVKFKVFGMLPLSLLFMLSQLPFLQRHVIDETKKT